MSGRGLYRIVAALAAGFVVWTLLNRLVFDPQAASFLSHKTALAHPLRLPVWLRVLDIHIVAACLALLAGALNFSDRLLRNHRLLHRVTGYVYIVSVLAVCVTSGYMAPYATGGRAVSMAFNLMNMAWIAMTVTALVQIRRRRVDKHRRWMVRSYAFCFTNLSIHALTWTLTRLLGLSYEAGYASSVFGTIVLLGLAAELVIRLFFRTPFRLPPAKVDAGA
ncbi:DUF2306 domain-containing protein [Cohnella nanjingensis]|uniref:DUF2306 domain-containing protein n=1 Tax=Cohnella nanjingensis TaxID=1387779 RepID=A0A7X0RQS1_9BACL|nr:DUF2306 domain-containing protein [Cohnella nanjingensis]MBB6671927.1 DUF2306 domain-containing protein [Cohnella nanjingensis]